MKKFILLITLLNGFALSATHLMGGEITVSVNPNNIAHFVLTLYKDNSPNTAGLGTNQNLDVSGMGTVKLHLTSLDTLVSQYPITRHIYTGSAQLPSYGSFTAYWFSCCRNNAIDNITNPGNQGFMIITEFTAYQGTSNSTPVFLNTPMVTFPLDSLWTYNPLPFDADGDSLHWSLDTPKVLYNSSVLGYSHPPSNPNGSFNIDPNSGLISWSPSQIGNFATSILVEEYRNGNKIGEIRRDFQFIVIPDSTQMSLNVPSTFGSGNGNNQVSIFNGQSISFNFNLTSSDSNSTLSLEATGPPFAILNSNAQFQVTQFTSDSIEGKFTWTPSYATSYGKPYPLNVRASDGEFCYDYTFLILVQSGVSLKENYSSGELSIYPNPSSGTVSVKLSHVSKSTYTIEILNLQGQKIQELAVDNADLKNGTPLEIDAIPATYILRLKEGTYTSKTFIIK